MANWEDIRVSISRAANRSIQKAEELADTASLHIKLKTVTARLSEKYENLGRLTYRQLKTPKSQAEAIAKTVEEIDALRAEALDIKNQIEEAKKAREEKAHDQKEFDAAFDATFDSDPSDEKDE